MACKSKFLIIWAFLIKYHGNVEAITEGFLSAPICITIQILVSLKCFISYFCSLAGIIKYDWKWLPATSASMVIIIPLCVILKKLKRFRQTIGLLLFISQSLSYIEIHLHLPNPNMVLVNAVLVSFLFIPLLTDTMRRHIYSYGLFLVFHIYILLCILLRDTNDIKKYPLWLLLLNLLYNFIISGTCLSFCIIARTISTQTITSLQKTVISWKSMMDNLRVLIVIVENGRILYKNKQTQMNLESSNSDFDEIFMRAIIEGQSDKLEILGKQYSVTRENIFFNDKISSLYTLHDITTVIKDEEDRFTQRLIATVTHELRSPLGIMMATYDLLIHKIKSEDEDIVRKGMIAGKMQENLINDILDIAKINSNKLVLCPVNSNLVIAVNEIVDILQFKINNKSVKLVSEIEKDFPKSIEIDERRFKQIIINLISNSIKFTSLGKIVISMKFREGYIILQVSDTGVGIKYEEQSIIFKKFGMAKSTLKMNQSGTGLGLNLCKHLVEEMGGSITFHSEPNILTTFELRIPVLLNNDISTEDDQTFEAFLGASNIIALHIDDDQFSICALRAFAKTMGILEYSFTNPLEALDLIHSKGFIFSVAFIDINMPMMNGYELAGKFCELNVKSPLIALTGEDKGTISDKCKKCGFFDVLEKPLSFVKYNQIIDSLNKLHTRSKYVNKINPSHINK